VAAKAERVAHATDDASLRVALGRRTCENPWQKADGNLKFAPATGNNRDAPPSKEARFVENIFKELDAPRRVVWPRPAMKADTPVALRLAKRVHPF
jgi:hypothetical protein